MSPVVSCTELLSIPVTGKIRLGWDESTRNYKTVAKVLEDSGASLIAVHGRTKAQAYKGEADWDAIAEVKQTVSLPVIGNGDVRTVADIARIKAHTGCDGVMIGRAAIGNPWIFARKDREQVTVEEKIALMRRHLALNLDFYGPEAGLILFRKHAARYIHGLPGEAQLRIPLLTCETVEAFDHLISDTEVGGQKSEVGMFTLQPLTSMLHLIPIPTPFPVGPVNVVLAEGNPLTLIDTGPKDGVALAALQAGLAQHGRRVEDLRRIVLTHHHADHIGLVAQLVARSGAEVLTHPYNLPWLSDYAAERERHRPFFRRIWDEAGVPEEIVTVIDQAGGGFTEWIDPFPDAKPINEGDTLTLQTPDSGLQTWKVFHTPGHAGGLICLWDEASRTLISNDHLIGHISSNPVLEPPPLMNGPRPKRLVEYLREMQRMAALEPRLALPGHGDVIEDVPDLVRRRLTFHQHRAEKILDVLGARPLTLWELTQPIFPRLTRPMDFFLALSEILGHLDLLEEEGKAQPVREGKLVKWTA